MEARRDRDGYATGTVPGAGSYRCSHCGFAVSLTVLDQVPECPSCGGASFARASLFHTSIAGPARPSDHEDREWLEAVRDELDAPGYFLAYRDSDRIAVMPLAREWTRIGRSLTAHIRFDDPTIARRHALIVKQADSVRVLDDRSLNGVFVNGERVEWSHLEDGDELVIGRYRLHFLASRRLRAAGQQRGGRPRAAASRRRSRRADGTATAVPRREPTVAG